MRLLLPLLLLVTTPMFAAEVSLVRVWPEYRGAASFKRIAEYFGGTEARRGQTILRTRPEQRDGYYFLTRIKSAAAMPGAMLVVQAIRPGNNDAEVHFFPADLPKGSHAFLVGLTGEDWTDGEVNPLAWQVRVLGADGTELAREQSFLWEQPVLAAASPPAE